MVVGWSADQMRYVGTGVDGPMVFLNTSGTPVNSLVVTVHHGSSDPAATMCRAE